MIEWFQAHWADILAIWGGVVALATVIVKLTPTKKDDAWLSWIVKVADNFSVVNPSKKDE
jgi:type IV secretory pathway component VirB8